jgi:hypothetical protein
MGSVLMLDLAAHLTAAVLMDASDLSGPTLCKRYCRMRLARTGYRRLAGVYVGRMKLPLAGLLAVGIAHLPPFLLRLGLAGTMFWRYPPGPLAGLAGRFFLLDLAMQTPNHLE